MSSRLIHIAQSPFESTKGRQRNNHILKQGQYMNKSLLKARYIVQSSSNFTFAFNVTINMKATEQCFPAILFIMLYKVVLIFKPRRWMKPFSVILFIESC